MEMNAVYHAFEDSYSQSASEYSTIIIKNMKTEFYPRFVCIYFKKSIDTLFIWWFFSFIVKLFEQKFCYGTICIWLSRVKLDTCTGLGSIAGSVLGVLAYQFNTFCSFNVIKVTFVANAMRARIFTFSCAYSTIHLVAIVCVAIVLRTWRTEHICLTFCGTTWRAISWEIMEIVKVLINIIKVIQTALILIDVRFYSIKKKIEKEYKRNSPPSHGWLKKIVSPTMARNTNFSIILTRSKEITVCYSNENTDYGWQISAEDRPYIAHKFVRSYHSNGRD